MNFFFRPGVRRQLEDEIRAQFSAFAATGLELDHVNAQNHMHVHPTILAIILKIGREFGLRAIRIPDEPVLPAWRATRSRLGSRLAQRVLLAPWIGLMRARLRRAGIAANDYIFGMIDSGHMDVWRVRNYIAQLPDGVSEIYSHPATQVWPGADPPDADYTGELAALVDPSIIAAARVAEIRSVSYGELACA